MHVVDLKVARIAAEVKAQAAELRESAIKCYEEGVNASDVQSLLMAADACDEAAAFLISAGRLHQKTVG